MNIKTGVNAFSSKPQPPIQKSDGMHRNSAIDESKLTGEGEDIGAVLNRVADPNYVDPAKKTRAVGNAELGKDAFMNLLLTQMKSQDPTNPLKSHEMAAQLAQFTSLEKLTNIETGIDKLRTENKPDKNFEALALIGKSVVTDSTKISRVDQKSNHDLKFRLAADAVKTVVTIKDAKGNAVRELTFNNVKEGKNNLTWNGQLEDGTQAPIGDYTIEVEARNSAGTKLFAQMKSQGVITGINFTGHGPQVLVGKDAIDLADIKSISDSTAGEQESVPGIPAGLAKAMNAIGKPAAQGGAGAPALPLGGVGELPQMMQPSGNSPIPSAENATPVQPAKHEKMKVKAPTVENSAKRARLAQGSLTDAKMPGSLYKELLKQGAGEG